MDVRIEKRGGRFEVVAGREKVRKDLASGADVWALDMESMEMLQLRRLPNGKMAIGMGIETIEGLISEMAARHLVARLRASSLRAVLESTKTVNS